MVDNVETLLREIIAGQAVFRSELETVKAQGTKAADSAAKALEVSNRISTILEEQNLGERFAEHKRDIREHMSEIRQDFVHANTEVRKNVAESEVKVLKEIADLTARVKVLEDDRQQRNGAKNLVTWISEKAPWLVAVAAAVAAAAGWGEKLK